MASDASLIDLPVGVFIILRDIIRDRVGTSFEDDKRDLLLQSEMAFRAALYLNPKSAVAAHNLAIALVAEARLEPAQAGKIREAVVYFNKACQLDPDNAEFRQHLDAAREQVARMPS